jgi:hypothetical protein
MRVINRENLLNPRVYRLYAVQETGNASDTREWQSYIYGSSVGRLRRPPLHSRHAGLTVP